jgi:regulator of protease activity HflC (stomatin/prohibitin superfamily)
VNQEPDKEPESLPEPKKVSKWKAVLASAGRITKKTLRTGLLVSLIAAPTLSFVNMWTKWVYQVKENYGVVITEWDGERTAITEPGWHSRTPFVSTYENDREQYPLANQMVFLHGKNYPHKIITQDGKVTVASATTFYEITDLDQYAIENVKGEALTITEERAGLEHNVFAQQTTEVITMAPKDMIQRTLDSIIGGHIQETEQKRLIHSRGEVEKEILEKLVNSDISKTYGIKINDFCLTDTNYIPKVIVANAIKQEKQALAEGDFAAAQIKTKTIDTLAQADGGKYKTIYGMIEKVFNPKTLQEKKRAQEIFKDLMLYQTLKERSGDTVWMVNGEQPTPVYQPKK